MKKIKRVVIFPLFLRTSELCKDEFWKQLLEDMAYGKHPKNIFVSNNSIIVGKNKATISYEGMNENDVIDKIIPFLQTYTSIYSCSDMKAMKKRHNLAEQLKREKEHYKNIKWTQIRKTNFKKLMLLDFVNIKRLEHKLSWEKSKMLYKDLSDVVCKQGMSKKVEYQNGAIIYIEGLDFTEGDYTLVKNIDDLQKMMKTTKKSTKWESYVKKYLKHLYEELF
jgi:hypothetical protein